MQHVSDLHAKFALRPDHVRLRKGEEKRRRYNRMEGHGRLEAADVTLAYSRTGKIVQRRHTHYRVQGPCPCTRRAGKKHCMSMLFFNAAFQHRPCSHDSTAPANTSRLTRAVNTAVRKLTPVFDTRFYCTAVLTAREHGQSVPTLSHRQMYIPQRRRGCMLSDSL